MADQHNHASGISNAPIETEQQEQAKVPPKGESRIGKGQNRKPSSPQDRPEQAPEDVSK